MRAEDKALTYSCQICYRQFSSKNSLKVHLESHDTTKKYKCKDCEAAFHTQGSYYAHIRRHNGNSTVCHYCGKTFYHNDKFKCHLRTHTGEKPFMCKNCPKTFSSRDNLKRHDMLVHKNDHDFSCDTCSEKFVFYQNYLDHLKCHKTEENFQCDLCKKTMKSKSLLLRHIRVHTGVKPYKCELCNARFSDSSNKNRHMKNHQIKNSLLPDDSNENSKQLIPSQNEVKESNLVMLDLRNSEVKLFILINQDEKSNDKVAVIAGVKTDVDMGIDYLYDPIKPGQFIEDGFTGTESNVAV